MQKNKIQISWDEYYQLIYNLAKQIKPEVENGNITQILSLARGGNIVGDAISRIFNLPLAIMFTSSYNQDNLQKKLIIGDSIAKQYNKLSNKILIVDDLVDSGKTLLEIKEFFIKTYFMEIQTGVLWKKTTCNFIPNYYVNEFLPNDWIIQPFENLNF